MPDTEFDWITPFKSKWNFYLFKMELNDIPFVRHQLKIIKNDKIQLLHSLIFDIDLGRGNRKSLWQFKGFPFFPEGEQFIEN